VIEDVIAAVPELDGARSIEPLAGGLTNVNYKVTSPAGCFVVRISGKDTGLLAIDRENEAHNTRGEVMDAEKMRRGDRLPAVASACLALHRGPRFLHDFDMFEIQRGYIQVVQERGFRLPARYLEFEPQVRALEAAMRLRPEPTVPCNNDLLAENFIDVGGTMRLIDYEYSGNNEPSFELGNVWSESNLSLAQLGQLVAAYYGRPLANKVARCRVWGLMSKYGWTLWGSIQDGISDIDFDFWGWAMEKYDRAVVEFDGPQFEQLLADVQRED
jgi:thiamine kinase-like enzyme